MERKVTHKITTPMPDLRASKLHRDIIKVITTHLESDKDLTPKDIKHYFESSAAGLAQSLAFTPDRDAFLWMLEQELS